MTSADLNGEVPGPIVGPGTTGHPAENGTEMVRHEEHLGVTVETVAYRTVRVVRRVITETVMVPVVLRREVLEIQTADLGDRPAPQSGQGGLPLTASDIAPQLVLELHEEEPVVGVRVRATERVHIGIRRLHGTTVLKKNIRAEQVVVETAARRPAAEQPPAGRHR